MSGYKKFCYWVDLHGLKMVKKDIEGKEIDLPDETRIPCRVLRESMSIALIAPSAWNGFCKRRTSWYRKSDKAEKFLIVSKKPLDIPGHKDPITIVESNFKPGRLPSQKEILELIELDEYRKKKTKAWDKPDLIEKDFYQRCFERYGGKGSFDFNKILISHSANHANFIDPQFFENVKGKKAPYSISDSLYVCSSCLEFFNILGNRWPIKYVVPCIGSVLFAKLPMNQYLKVQTHSNES